MLVDWDTSDSGCNGGFMEYSFTWLKKNGGIMTDTDYPYKEFLYETGPLAIALNDNPLQTY